MPVQPFDLAAPTTVTAQPVRTIQVVRADWIGWTVRRGCGLTR
ncbi:hypothetical protein SFC15_18795 [Shouchella clausii]